MTDLTLKTDTTHSCFVPLVSSTIAAGFPSPADDFVDSSINLNEFLIHHPAATFLMRVSGLSMQDAGIINDDFVIVDRSITAKNGHIVIALIDNEFTLKYLHKYHDGFRLSAANKDFSDIVLTPNSTNEIWGVVTGSFRKYTIFPS